MASFQQIYYCKKCKKNVSIDETGHCKNCGNSQISKSWSVRFRYVEEDGKERQKRLSGYETKKECSDAYTQFMAQAKNYEKIVKRVHELTFEELYEEYKEFTKSRIKESSFYDFNSKCNLHILPYFKNYKVKEITPKVILDWQNSKNKYSYKYKRNLRNDLNLILNYAQKYYKIINQLKEVDNFRNLEKKKEMQVWTVEEFYQFIEKVDKPEYKTLFYALYFTGARLGEILATQWKDWNLDKKTLIINKSITRKVYNKAWDITTPKNESSNRIINLSNNLTDIMKGFKKESEFSQPEDFVFYGSRPLPETSIERTKTNACKKANVKVIRIHDFRHSHASLLLSQGVSVVAVSKRLGHSNIEQTLNTYAHAMPQEEDLLVSILDNLAVKTGKNEA